MTQDDDPDAAGSEAIEWFLQHRAGPLSIEQQRAFEKWLVDDPKNSEAFDEVLKMYNYLARMSPSPRRKRRGGRAPRIVGAAMLAAASLAIAVSFEELSTYLRSDYYAGTGERKSVMLEDGSHAELDARTAIKVTINEAERRVELLSGEAWFQVASDAARPFVVQAGVGTVTALGTAFDVALESGNPTRVTVSEHSVRLSSYGGTVIVNENEQSVFGPGAGVQPPKAVDTSIALAWRRGKLIVEKRPFNEVLAALGRHRHGIIQCVRPSTCSRKISGVFEVDDPLQSLREIEMSLGLTAVRLTNYLIFLF